MPAPRPASRDSASLRELALLVGASLETSADVGVTGVTLDSRAVQPGDLYAALPGARAHGADFAAQAAQAGAAAVLTEEVDVAGAVDLGDDPRGQVRRHDHLEVAHVPGDADGPSVERVGVGSAGSASSSGPTTKPPDASCAGSPATSNTWPSTEMPRNARPTRPDRTSRGLDPTAGGNAPEETGRRSRARHDA